MLAALFAMVLQGSVVAQQSLACIGPQHRSSTARPLELDKPTNSPNATGAADPTSVSLLSRARTLYIDSDTAYLPASVLEEKLMARPEFGRLGLVITHVKREAELIIDVERIFTRFTYSVLDPTSFYVFESGLVRALFGTASDKIAKKLLATLTNARKVPQASDGGPAAPTYRYSDVDMPVSLALGTVRTLEFAVKREAYFIMIQAEKRLPFHEQECMMALPSGPTMREGCDGEPLLQADWTVWDEGRLVARGTIPSEGWGMYTDQHMFKIIGPFMGESGRKYVVEMKFTKDGARLNACNPHLIVVRVRYH